MTKVYCLKRKKSTKELHLFECTPTQPNGCTCEDISVCDKMKKLESEGSNLFSCQNENDARQKCAEIGRQVCGLCVSHLHETYED